MKNENAALRIRNFTGAAEVEEKEGPARPLWQIHSAIDIERYHCFNNFRILIGLL